MPEDKGMEALSNYQKASMLAKKFQEVHCGDNIGENGIRDRDKTLNNQEYKLEFNDDISNQVNLFFSLKALQKAKVVKTGPVHDVFKHCNVVVLYELLALINNACEDHLQHKYYSEYLKEKVRRMRSRADLADASSINQCCQQN